jgi:hypothetical protein
VPYSGAIVEADTRLEFIPDKTYDARCWNAMVASRMSGEKPGRIMSFPGKPDSDFVRALREISETGADDAGNWVEYAQKLSEKFGGPLIGEPESGSDDGDEWESYDEG